MSGEKRRDELRRSSSPLALLPLSSSSLTDEDVWYDSVFAYESLPADNETAEGLTQESEAPPEGVSDEVTGGEGNEEDRRGREGDVEVFLREGESDSQLAS